MLRALSAQFVIQAQPIADAVLLRPLASEGARIAFVGLVRDYNQHRSGIWAIEYHCYEEMALREGQKILEQALRRFEISRIACVHRIGLLELQEVAIRLEIGSGHRLPAMRACEYIMDQIKQQVPIWKKEYDQSGGVWT